MLYCCLSQRAFTNVIFYLDAALNWVQCDKCNKWRVLLEGGEEELPEEWFCSMNTDIRNNTCDAPERDAMWYENVRVVVYN